MATVSRIAPVVNLPAVAWHALAKVAGKEAVRDDLSAGATHLVNLAVLGDIDGQPFEQSLAGVLTVGHDSTRATSATPALPNVIASILAKLNTATRDAILRDLPNEFEAAGCRLPEVPAELVDKTESMLSRLRAKQSVDVRGSVSCKYALRGGSGGTGAAYREATSRQAGKSRLAIVG